MRPLSQITKGASRTAKHRLMAAVQPDPGEQNVSDRLVEFLRARLDEDEAFAEMAANGGGEWVQRGRFAENRPVEEKSSGRLVVPDTGVPDQLEAIHIARHNPARILRDVQAKLGILDRYRPDATDPHPGLPCTNSVHFDPDGDEYDPDVTCERHSRAVDERPDGVFGSTAVLRLLALPYADHPDYQPEWAPDACPSSALSVAHLTSPPRTPKPSPKDW